ncbi:DUF2878 family protein [Pseudidiomarina salinarum]|uniref:DUF2878 family protein n=1 Tax=Pseudidiomarina salinarum TaxID=435908 RepID=UPI00068AC665|nr:DUF2878 family protein [Pseudidiomarina salinarum]RUO70245.1 DUF2878 domain-containing protein [Pseudidiomarina salinarum]
MSLASSLARPFGRRLFGILWFDLVWLSAVAGRHDWLLVTLGLVLTQIVVSARTKIFNWTLYLGLLGCGILLEWLVVALDVLSFTGGLVPLWLVLLWCGFAAMIITTLDWLAGRYFAAALLGAISGPVTYAVGVRLGAAELIRPEWQMWLIYGTLWALYMMLYAWAIKRFGGSDVKDLDNQSAD